VFFNHHSDMPATMSLAQPRQLIGPVIFKSGAARAPMERQSVKAEGLGDVELDLEGHVLTARLDDGASVSFDLVGALQELKRRGWPEADDHAPIALQGAAQGLTGAMLIDGMGGSYDDRDSNFSMLRFWLLLARAP
jgi:hypothetical protein